MKISVIIPAYNNAKTIEKTIDSILAQKGADLEVIVVNDGSVDNTKEVLAKYSDRITVIDKENGGVSSARNLGLSKMMGEFVMFIDADDEFEDGCIETIVSKQRQYDADIVRFEYFLVYPDGTKKKPLHYFDKEEFVTKKDFREKIYPHYINGIQMNTLCMTLFKSTLFDGLQFRTDMKTAEDALLGVNIYSRAENVLILPNEYYMYNQTENSITGSGLGILKKYSCNMKLSCEIIKHLGEWKMKTPYWFFKTLLRPIVLTLDKIRRINMSKQKVEKR